MLLTSPLSSPLKNPVRDVFSPAGGAPLSLTAQVQALFAGRAGGMWDFGDLSTLFQDTAGATPVTTVAQTIARANDISGNGKNATQATAGSRPAYQTNGAYNCARFSAHVLSTGNIDLSASTMALVSIAFAPNAWTFGFVSEFGPNAFANNGSLYVSLGESGAGFFYLFARSTANDIVRNTSSISLSTPVVLTAYIDLSVASATAKLDALINGASGGTTVIADAADASANWMNSSMNFGGRNGGSVFSSCDVFAAVIRGGSATAGEIALVDEWTRSRVGL